MNNIEIINGIEVDWNKFKSKSKGKHLERSKQSYIDLYELLHNNDHKLLSNYIDATTKVLIDFNCGHEPNWLLPSNYRKGNRCPRCVGKGGQAKEDLINLVNDNGHKLLSEYKDTTTKVLIDFNCGHEPNWLLPSNYKNGQGCPRCIGKGGQAKIDFINRLNDNGHKLLSEYIDATTKVLIDFNCGHEPYAITPNSYKSGHRCLKCAGNCPEQAKIDFIKLMNEQGHELLSEYKRNNDKVLIDFKCGHESHWITPNSYKRGNRCPRCVGKGGQAKEDLMKFIEEQGHELLSEYKSTREKVLIDFKCEHEPHWILPDHYKKGCGCPRCVGKGGQAKEDFINMINNNGHELLSEYVNNSTKVLIDFNCGHEPHWIRPYEYKNGNRCPLCKNKGEGALYNLLINMGYKVETQKKYEDLKDKDYLKYDFYLLEYNLLIELDGDHHREAVIYKKRNMTDEEISVAMLNANKRLQCRQHKDRLKDDYAKDNNIHLLRIEYSDAKIELDKWKQLILDKISDIENVS